MRTTYVIQTGDFCWGWGPTQKDAFEAAAKAGTGAYAKAIVFVVLDREENSDLPYIDGMGGLVSQQSSIIAKVYVNQFSKLKVKEGS